MNVGGVGYEVSAPMSTFYQLPDIGGEITLLTHLVVREDAQLLYGFYHKQERQLFRALIKVNGVGPKLALTILSGIEADQFVQCIRQGNSASLVRIPGIGKKTAERLIIETRDALKTWQSSQQTALGDNSARPESALQDAIDALCALGYKPNEAKQALDAVYEADVPSEQLIRQALKRMVQV